METDLSAKKILDARKCPQCGSNLMAPYEEGNIKGDEVCAHCLQSIMWARHYIALLKDELKGNNEKNKEK